MSVTSGFFNSLNHDRRYNAQQMSAIFDGIINDGVFANIGVAFKVNADTGVTISIGEGKAWFASAWVYNDALLPMTLEGSEVVLDRIDAVVIDVDHNDTVRLGSIKVVKGMPSSSPKRPTMVSDKKHSQHPLAYMYREAGSTEITQADITNMVGTSECPYITGILQVQNIDNIVAQWNAQWNEWYAEKVAETDSDASVLLAEMKSEFDIWFDDFKSVLDDDVATSLATQVADLMGKFDTLAKEGAVYDTIEDSDLDEILGDDGTPITGKTVLGGGADVDTSRFVLRSEFNDKAESLATFINRVDLEKVSLKLLWENASMDSEFAAQNVDIDLSEYAHIMVEFVSAVPAAIIRKNKTWYIMQLNVTSTSANKTVIEARRRAITFNDTRVNFTDCNSAIYTSTSAKFGDTSVLNTNCIPYRIYGMKGAD